MSEDPKDVMQVAFIDKEEEFDMGLTSSHGQGLMLIFNSKEGTKNALIFRDEALGKLLTGCQMVLNLYEGTNEGDGERPFFAVPEKSKVTLH